MSLSVLYITHDDLAGHIGQSQVAPYLIGLAKLGHRITLLSAEKTGARGDTIAAYQQLFKEHGIDWHYVSYHNRPPLFSTVYDLTRMRNLARRLVKKNKINAVHCRCYNASLIGLHLKRSMSVKFIFDMRDFWIDACKETRRLDVDGSLLHRGVYNFFKQKEREFLSEADHIVSLTEAGKRVMEGWAREGTVPVAAPISVIPCCADFSFYDRARLSPERLSEVRRGLGLGEKDFVLSYLGSLPLRHQIPVYLVEEMVEFFCALLKRRPEAKFLVIANNNHDILRDEAKRQGVPLDRLIFTSGSRDQVPYLVAQSDLAVFFIMPSFAKQGCSPVKLAELLAMNVPVVSNTRVGDLDTLLEVSVNGSAVVKHFEEDEYLRVLDRVLSALGKHVPIRENSVALSLPAGVQAYDRIYRELGKL